MIDSYKFGEIVIDGVKRSSDVIIHPGRVQENWRRKEGHCLRADDLASVFEEKPDILVIGTGYSGMMSVPGETKDLVLSKGIKLIVLRTKEAVAEFNRLSGGGRVCGAFHLTC